MRGIPKKPDWPQIWYGPNGEVNSYDGPLYIPRDFTPYPQKPDPIKEPPKSIRLDRSELIQALKDKGVTVDPRWSASKMEELLKED